MSGDVFEQVAEARQTWIEQQLKLSFGAADEDLRAFAEAARDITAARERALLEFTQLLGAFETAVMYEAGTGVDEPALPALRDRIIAAFEAVSR